MAVRLSREARRDQLVALGSELVAASSFEAVSVDDVAAAAGISRGLLFHYFPTMRDFHVALAEHAAAQLLEATAPPAELPALARLRDATRAFVAYVAARPDAYVSLVRGAASGDAALREVGERTRAALADRVLDGLGLDPVPPAVTLVVRGWVAGSEEVVVAWLRGEAAVSQDEVVELVVAGLAHQLAAALPADEVARVLGPS